MTQELVLGVLLTGMVGLIWAMTVSVLRTDQPDRKGSRNEAEPQDTEGSSNRQTLAA